MRIVELKWLLLLFGIRYKLLHCIRTHMGSSDDSYGCIYQCEDEAGHIGVHLSKDLMTVAGRALKSNITALGPLVLPFSEQLKFMITHIKRKVRLFSSLGMPVMSCGRRAYWSNFVACRMPVYLFRPACVSMSAWRGCLLFVAGAEEPRESLLTGLHVGFQSCLHPHWGPRRD